MTESSSPAPIFSRPEHALTRTVSESFQNAIRSSDIRIDVARARRQHHSYVAALRDAGITVSILPPVDMPDGCFIEDVAVLLPNTVAIARPGAPQRRSEVASVAQFLQPNYPTVQLSQPNATLDGGDVMRMGQTLFIGLSSRTNEAGAQWLAKHAHSNGIEAIPIPLQEGLHLKSVVTVIDQSTLSIWADGMDPAHFRDRGIACIEASEFEGANLLGLGDTIIASAAAPRTIETLVRSGRTVKVVEVDEFHNADGALTCLSLRFSRANAWCV